VSRLVPAYRSRPSALHQAGAGTGTAFCAALGLFAVVYEHPLVLLAALGAIAAAGSAAGVRGELRRGARVGAVIALSILAINPIVSQNGQTVLVRGWELLGWRFDVTLEALAYGGVAGLRALVLVLAFALYSAAIDPDELLRLWRRVSYRSALTASLATRLVPVLGRDASRLSDAARCRAVAPGRAAVVRGALEGALERAVEIAAALELRGYASARRPAPARRVRSRHDLRVAASAALVAASALGGKLLGAASFEAYPVIGLSLGPAEGLLAGAVLAGSVAPFAGSGALGVARG
jgi:energy-coupling factor transport system permease protein